MKKKTPYIIYPFAFGIFGSLIFLLYIGRFAIQQPTIQPPATTATAESTSRSSTNGGRKKTREVDVERKREEEEKAVAVARLREAYGPSLDFLSGKPEKTLKGVGPKRAEQLAKLGLRLCLCLCLCVFWRDERKLC